MTKPSNLATILGEDEATFGENVAMSAPTQYLTLGIPVFRPEQPLHKIDITRQYPNDGIQPVLGLMGGELTFRLALTGHGSSAAGALTETDLNALLGDFIGNSKTNSVGTACDGTGDEGAPGVDAGTFDDGSLCRIGARGDARGGGQWAGVSTLAGGVLTLHNDLAATPDDGDVVYAAQLVYPDELPASLGSVTGKRFQALTANGQWLMRGCFPRRIRISGQNIGGRLEVELTYGVTWFEKKSDTFPDTTGTDAKEQSVVGGGQVWYNVAGTPAHQTVQVPQWELTIEVGVVPRPGQNPANALAGNYDAVRTGVRTTFRTTFWKGAAGTDTWYDIAKTAAADRNFYDFVFGLNIEDKTAIGIRMQRCAIMGNVPIQGDFQGLNAVTVEWEALRGTTLTTDLTAASVLFGFA